MSRMPVNVICLKWGDLYGPEYVNVLYRMVKRHLHGPFRFICSTDDSVGLAPDIEVYPLPEFEEPPWEYARYCSAWRKLALFKKGFADMEGQVLFLDLDVVIVDALAPFFETSSATVSMIENWYQLGQGVGQASVIAFEAGKPEFLLERYLEDPVAVLKQYPTEQAYISGALGDACSFFPQAWCRSYKKHCMPQGLAKFTSQQNCCPEDARILVFHGRPNPPDAINGAWGKQFPWYKRWYKRIKPSPWLAEHWC